MRQYVVQGVVMTGRKARKSLPMPLPLQQAPHASGMVLATFRRKATK